MAIDVAELETMRDALIRARSSGVRVVMVEGKRLEYGTDAEMAAAIANLEARIARATGKGPPARFATFRRT